jgi:hypothetical protein
MMGLIYTYNNAHSYHPSRINDTANVSVSNGKLSISIPAVHMVDTQTMDTTVLSVHVSE